MATTSPTTATMANSINDTAPKHEQTAPAPLGVHLVGSLCNSATASAAMLQSVAAFPHRLRRLPDGEPAIRGSFIAWQRDVFAATPTVLRQYDAGFNSVPLPPVGQDEVREIVAAMPPLLTRYDDAALESYEAFARLRERGEVPAGTRFQVCVPTPSAIMCMLRPEFQLAVEPLYTRALVGALRRIQDSIPHGDLAFQIDVATETLAIEGLRRGDERCWWPHFEPYWPAPHFEGVVERVARLIEAVDEDVQVGFHVCHGDWKNKHFVEPQDLGLAVDIANAVTKAAGRELNWWHLPVPKERSDIAYFEPLRKLEAGSAELFLGLVHPFDEEGTFKRLRAAREVVGNRAIGVASECGLGRTPADKFQSIADIATKVSAPQW